MPRTFPNLYELTAPWAEQLADVDSEQADYNPFDDIDAREESDNAKLAECCRVVRNLELFGNAAKEEAKRLADKAKGSIRPRRAH